MTLLNLPPELHVNILTYLRANDLSRIQRTCQIFNDRQLIHSIIDNFANEVYPPQLSQGFDTPAIGGEVHNLDPNNQFWTYEALRNMEMLVVARILSRPEPPTSKCQNAYYVSKSWCRAALKWLDVQAQERKQREREQKQRLEEEEADVIAQQAAASPSGKKQFKPKPKQKKKQSKKQERKNNKLSAKLSGTPPPSLDVNKDITCEHGCLRYCAEGRGNRAKRRLLDKQAWKILKKLYPQGAQLSSLDGECLQCTMEVETEKRSLAMKKQRKAEERKMPLGCPIVRGFYSRRSGVPKDYLIFQPQENVVGSSFSSPVARKFPMLRNGAICPLVPGVYNILPKSWCYMWRRYIKTGEGGKPSAPDTSACLCDAHRLPLIPPHLESFLSGTTASLMDTAVTIVLDDGNGTPLQSAGGEDNRSHTPRSLPVGFYPVNQQLGGDSQDRAFGTPRERIIGGERIPLTQPRVAMNDEISQLRASGLSEHEIQLQRFAMLQIEEQRAQREVQERRRQFMINGARTQGGRDTQEEVRAKGCAQLDRENKVVVEIITDEEMEALEKWWPGIHSSYSLKFAVVELDAGTMDVIWTTQPCKYCDASGKGSDCDVAVRNRNRSWVHNTPKKKFGK